MKEQTDLDRFFIFLNELNQSYSHKRGNHVNHVNKDSRIVEWGLFNFEFDKNGKFLGQHFNPKLIEELETSLKK